MKRINPRSVIRVRCVARTIRPSLAVVLAAVLLTACLPSQILAWQNALHDPGFERYHLDPSLGYYVPNTNAAWSEYGAGRASVRFNASGWSAPTEMLVERPLGFSPGAAGFTGYGATDNKGVLYFDQNIVNSVLLHSGQYYEAWVWLGGAGQDITPAEDRAEEIGGWEIYFYDHGDTASWRDDNAVEFHHATLDYPGSPAGFYRVSGYGRIPGNAVGLRFRAWARSWHAPAGGGSFGTQVALDNAHFGVITGDNLLRNGNFERDAAPGDFTGWQRPAFYPFPRNGIEPLDLAAVNSVLFNHGTYRPFYGDTRSYGYNTYLNGWLDDAFTFSQTVNYSAPAGTPVVLMCYWIQDSKGLGWRWQLRQGGGQLQFVVQYLNSVQVLGTQDILVNWPVASNPANESSLDQNGDRAYNPRFHLVPPAGTTQIRLNVNKMVHLPWQPGWELMSSVVDDFWLGLPDVPATIFNPRIDQIARASARVRWLSDVYTGSLVDFGTTTAYGDTASDPTPAQSHAVTLTNLMPGRKYYVLRRSGLARHPAPGSEATEFFTTLPYGDFDGDGDADQSDFGNLQACFSGPDVPQTNPACATIRLDGDTDVDTSELAGFLSCMTGANLPLGSLCAE